MDERKYEKRALKKAYKRAKRRSIAPWKGLTILLLVLSLIVVPLGMVLRMFDNTLAAFVGGTFWELKNEDPTPTTSRWTSRPPKR